MTIDQCLQIALERIFSDPALTNPLRDPEARVLLDWAQQQVQCLVAETEELDEEDAWAWLNPRLRTLRHAVRRIAQCSAEADDPMTAVKRRLSHMSALQEEDAHDEI